MADTISVVENQGFELKKESKQCFRKSFIVAKMTKPGDFEFEVKSKMEILR